MAAKGLLSYNDPTNAASPTNPNGVKTNAPGASVSPYAGGLQTTATPNLGTEGDINFVNGKIQSSSGSIGGMTKGADGSYSYNNSTSSDPDVQGLQALTNEDAAARSGQNQGVDFAHNSALESVYQGRIGEKNALSEQISGEPGLLNQEQDLNKATSGAALTSGLKNTRQNFNNRGLLYSGMRQGGEAGVQQQGAANLASAIAGTARDSANKQAAAESAYASVDLASSQDQLNRASNAFDTANANNIARLQAMQQLGSGAGAVAGTIAGGYSPSGTNPTTGWTPKKLQQPELGSSYGS